ncbi:MAG: 50S ribosomal protein L4 [Microgenomates group bacterium]|jgi:large subunit ribosomal protein L4|nr:50S ribosomal protein L4 [Candidatus Woesebacteria bacterium]MBP6882851.1 50S ribosomal protein L4 [Candidatus Woesebacteria bacterium]QQR63567.1 MAG: 50S ribosomal protein L4 [Candidatus Roizmanbacteria bacterium]
MATIEKTKTATTNSAKTAVAKKTTAPKPASSSLTLGLIDKLGKEVGSMQLPKELFGGKVNDALMQQYVHIYLTNQRQGTVSTKTRSEVRGSTRKIYRQKGTGRARHGAKKAPIFVGGGITFGPKPRIFALSMNKKQKKLALVSALSYSLKEKKISGVLDTVLGMEPKTKNFAKFLKDSGLADKGVLFIMPGEKTQAFMRASRNIQSASSIEAKSLNAYEILRARKIVLFESTIKTLVDHFYPPVQQVQGKKTT